MADHDGDEIGVDAWIDRFGADPVRLNVLTFLNGRPASVSQVAEKFGLSPEAAARHLDEMLDAGLIEVVGEALRRGKVEPRFRATVRILWTEDEVTKFSQAERLRLLAWIVQTVNADLVEALGSGKPLRDDAHAIRTVLQVDEQGWRELSRIHDDALEAVLEIQGASAERLAEAKKEGWPALSAMFCLELPGRDPRSQRD